MYKAKEMAESRSRHIKATAVKMLDLTMTLPPRVSVSFVNNVVAAA